MICNMRPNGMTSSTAVSSSAPIISPFPGATDRITDMKTDSATGTFNRSVAPTSFTSRGLGQPDDYTTRPGCNTSTPYCPSSSTRQCDAYMETERGAPQLDAFIRGRDPNQDPPCSYLSVGQAFEGTQHVSQPGQNATSKEEAWKVVARLQGCDPSEGYICGSMETLNVPSAKSSVVTFWEGEIVDNINYTFFTAKHWGTDRSTDLKHWSKFGCFAPLKEAVNSGKLHEIDLLNFPYIFMRWKEKCFVNVGPDCGLTIAGFYYICFARLDGCIEGFYYDPNSSPFQKLHLQATEEGRCGQSFASYSFR